MASNHATMRAVNRSPRSVLTHPALVSSFAGLAVLAGTGATAVYALDNAAPLLLLGAPFVSGFATAFVRNEWVGPAQLRHSLACAAFVLVLASLGVVACTHEGLLVVLMALPPAMVLAALGALMGHSTVRYGRPGMSPVVALLMCWPLLAAAEPEHPRPEPREILTTLDVQRSPAELERAMAFRATTEPAEWSFIAGIARPQPSREFELRALPDGRTRIEARTWYQLDMYPEHYWSLWSDAIIHRIHLRTLGQIERQADRARPIAE